MTSPNQRQTKTSEEAITKLAREICVLPTVVDMDIDFYLEKWHVTVVDERYSQRIGVFHDSLEGALRTMLSNLEE